MLMLPGLLYSVWRTISNNDLAGKMYYMDYCVDSQIFKIGYTFSDGTNHCNIYQESLSDLILTSNNPFVQMPL